jgi:hypothetical protein
LPDESQDHGQVHFVSQNSVFLLIFGDVVDVGAGKLEGLPVRFFRTALSMFNPKLGIQIFTFYSLQVFTNDIIHAQFWVKIGIPSIIGKSCHTIILKITQLTDNCYISLKNYPGVFHQYIPLYTFH